MGIRSRLSLAALVALALLGARDSGAAIRVPACVVDDTEPAGLVDVSIMREVLRQRPTILYRGVVGFTAYVVPDGESLAMSVVAVGPVPFAPASACTDTDKCQQALELICKAAGKKSAQKLSAKLEDGACKGSCADGTKVVAVCIDILK